jgi:hypothetical protein
MTAQTGTGMKTKGTSLGLAVYLFSIAGCGSSSIVSSSGHGDRTFEAFNVDAYDRSGTISFNDGSELYARNIVVAADSTRFLIEETGEARAVSTQTVSNVIFKNHGIGFLEGFGIGLAAGSLAVLALSADSSPSREFGSDYLLFFMAVGGGAGGVLGGIPGVIIGHSYDYQFVAGQDSAALHQKSPK